MCLHFFFATSSAVSACNNSFAVHNHAVVDSSPNSNAQLLARPTVNYVSAQVCTLVLGYTESTRLLDHACDSMVRMLGTWIPCNCQALALKPVALVHMYYDQYYT